jgi:diguanylate cyclase (GGDEF)-like protein/PAS domain S-box-containing protein
MASARERHMEALRGLGQALGRDRTSATQAAQRAADTVARVCGDACGVWMCRRPRAEQLAQAGNPAVEVQLDELLDPGELQPDRAGWPEERWTADGRAVVLPLVADGRTIGALATRRAPGAAPYDHDETTFLRAVADRLAAAVEVASLRHEVGMARTRTRALLQRSAEGVLVTDPDARIIFVGAAASALLGWDAQDLVGMSAVDLAHPDDVGTKRARFSEALERPGPVEPMDIRVRRADGSYAWVEDRITNMLDDPDVGGLVINFHDVAERRATQDALRRSESRYRSMAETAQEGIWVIAPEGRTTFANQKLAEILGRPLEQVLRMRSTEVTAEEDRLAHADRLRRREKTGHEMYEVAFIRGDGERRLANVSASPLFDDGRYVGSLGMFTDITDRRQSEEQLERQALYDGLTGLANRALLTDRLGQALAVRDETSAGVVVLFLDLDHFKSVNDTYGHAVGDRLLIRVAERLTSVVRAADTVARFAGDEFVVVCPGLDENGGNALAERAVDALAAPLDIDGIELRLGASVGVAHASPGQSIEAVVGAADAAMLEAKRAGRGGTATFDSAVAARAGAQLQEVAELRRGLDAGEFEVYYQPQVHLGTDRIVGVEALVRWQHPLRGLVEPAEFLPLAERTGLVVPLGRIVLGEACRQAAAWGRTSADGPRVSVNISARQLHDDGLVDLVRGTLADTGLPPGHLRLEVTEATVLDDADRAVGVLRELRSIGVGLSVDDFGTGLSSLPCLTRLPLAELKIDREFVAGVHLGGEDLDVVRAAVAMGHSLHLDVVAEGVESRATRDVVRDLGCDAAQGNLFAPAEPAGAVERLLEPA